MACGEVVPVLSTSSSRCHRDGHRDGNDGNSFKELSPSKLLQGMAAMTSTVIGRHQDERQQADEMRSQTQKQEMEVMSRLMGVAQNAVVAFPRRAPCRTTRFSMRRVVLTGTFGRRTIVRGVTERRGGGTAMRCRPTRRR